MGSVRSVASGTHVRVRPMKAKAFLWAITAWISSVSLCLAEGAQPTDLASAIRAVSRGTFAAPAMVEVEGFYKDRFQAVRLFSSGVGVADNQRQFSVSQETVKSVFKALDRFGFATMPEQFGGKPRPTNKPELRSAVTVRLGSWEKTVIQMRDGEQSKSFAKLVKRIFSAVEEPSENGVSVGTFNEGLKGIAEGTLAPETMSLTLAWEEQPKAFAVFSVSGLHVRWTPANGGEIRRFWLAPEKVQELAKLLLVLEPDLRPARFYWPKHVSLEVSVLNHRWNMEGQAWAGIMGERERSLAQRWESVELEVRRVLKEAMAAR
ncbi:MAG: hypothetical protein KatS3mg007_1314 [Thermoanaerobaculum sp.]|nr:MAG: hypothetical protein KatS3mg007_1314 [Thermoanaerobaculum sp.]